MDYLKEIYLVRQKLCDLKQPRHNRIIKKLDNLLNVLKVDHPYRLDRNQYELLMKIRTFSKGSKGLPASLPHDQYLYRICSLESLKNYVETWTLDSYRYSSLEEIFEHILILYSIEKDWLHLSLFAAGKYRNARKYSFWTLANVSENIYSWPNKLGMPADWISPHTILLRYPNYHLSSDLAKIPTVIDAFTEEIFHPVKELDNSKTGKTIDIGHADSLRDGVEEIVLGPVDIKRIDILPVFIALRDKAKHFVSLGPNLWSLLIKYYNQLGEYLL